MQFHWPALPPLSLATRGSLQTLCCLAPSGQQPKGLLYPVEWGSSWLATGSPRMTSLFMSCPPAPRGGQEEQKGRHGGDKVLGSVRWTSSKQLGVRVGWFSSVNK